MPALLFHKDVYAPKNLFSSIGHVLVKYSRHAWEAAQSDRYGNLTQYLDRWVDIRQSKIIEVELINGRITKRVVRHQVSEDLDMVFVINHDGYVRTVWGNLHNDKHKSLDTRKFVKEGNSWAR